jgi:hypothetical protein
LFDVHGAELYLATPVFPHAPGPAGVVS